MNKWLGTSWLNIKSFIKMFFVNSLLHKIINQLNLYIQFLKRKIIIGKKVTNDNWIFIGEVLY